MAGVYGSTFVSELNRLANGGTYPAVNTLDAAGAARAWAAARAVTLSNTDLVGVLNEIAGITDKRNYLDLAGICNLIASTTGLEPAAALRGLES